MTEGQPGGGKKKPYETPSQPKKTQAWECMPVIPGMEGSLK
jgi:hypothetical protein